METSFVIKNEQGLDPAKTMDTDAYFVQSRTDIYSFLQTLRRNDHQIQSDQLTPQGQTMELSLPYFEIKESNPMIIIISGISGAGKDTVINGLKNREDCRFHFVVTCNTRAKRAGEIDGEHYHFVTREKFLDMIAQDEMVEYSAVYDDFKGVPRFEFDKAYSMKRDMILRLDHQGAKKVKQAYPDAITIFIVPPSPQVWLDRLNKRGGDSVESLRTRLETATEEIRAIPEFDYLVVNDHLDQAVEDVITILKAEHRRTSRIEVNYKVIHNAN